MRTRGEGEQLIRAYTREGFNHGMRGFSEGFTDEALDEYWKGFADDTRRLGHLEMYRSGDFEKLKPYDGALASLDVPTLIVWGALDRFSTVKMAHRFHAEIPGSELVVFDQAGHFVWEDAPDQAVGTLVEFLERRVD
jgi:haloalkane dehalogenase